MAVFLFYGQEEYLMDKEIKRLKNELLDASFISMSYKVFDNPPFNTLLDCLQSAPLMFGNTLSVINIDKYLIGNTLNLDDKQNASIEFALSNITNNVNIIFVCKIPRDETKKPDSRKKFYKILTKYSQEKQFAQFKSYEKEKIAPVITGMAKERDLKIDNSGVEAIIEQLGVNLTLINSEIEKLKIAIYPETKITPSDVKKYCTSIEDIFILADLIVQGNKNEILKQYKMLTEKRHYLEVLAFLQSNLQKFIFIKSCEKRMSSKDMAMKLRPLTEYIIEKIKKSLGKISLERLIQIRENLLMAEYKLKSGQAAQEDTVLELALIS